MPTISEENTAASTAAAAAAAADDAAVAAAVTTPNANGVARTNTAGTNVDSSASDEDSLSTEALEREIAQDNAEEEEEENVDDTPGKVEEYLTDDSKVKPEKRTKLRSFWPSRSAKMSTVTLLTLFLVLARRTC